jgi:hypothetical protein
MRVGSVRVAGQTDPRQLRHSHGFGSVIRRARFSQQNADTIRRTARKRFAAAFFAAKRRHDSPDPRLLQKPARAANRFHAEPRFSQQNADTIRRTPLPPGEKVRAPTDVSAEPEIGGDVDEGDLSGGVHETHTVLDL